MAPQKKRERDRGPAEGGGDEVEIREDKNIRDKA